MMRVSTDIFEVVTDGVAVSYPTLAAARASRGAGQVRVRTEHTDVPAQYAVRHDGVEIDRFDRPADAAVFSRQHPGATVHMVPERVS